MRNAFGQFTQNARRALNSGILCYFKTIKNSDPPVVLSRPAQFRFVREKQFWKNPDDIYWMQHSRKISAA
jgi:hypothetical protein